MTATCLAVSGRDAVDEALKASGPKPESMESLKNDVKKRLGTSVYLASHQEGAVSCACNMLHIRRAVSCEPCWKGVRMLTGATLCCTGDWYMRHHGVNPASTVADMCVLLKAYWQVATKR